MSEKLIKIAPFQKKRGRIGVDYLIYWEIFSFAAA